MANTLKDRMVIDVLRCISLGAATAVLLILLVLPALLLLTDRWITGILEK